jgi:hypothetical protein
LDLRIIILRNGNVGKLDIGYPLLSSNVAGKYPIKGVSMEQLSSKRCLITIRQYNDVLLWINLDDIFLNWYNPSYLSSYKY